MDLKSILQKSLVQPKQELGDRTTYVGASDLGCERRGCLEKLTPSQKSVEILIRFKRGDLVETVVRQALEQNHIRHLYQYETVHPQKTHLKAHIDFVFENPTEMGVLECKSVSSMPSEPYEGWIKQLYYQMGLLSLQFPGKKIKGAFAAMDLMSGAVCIFNGYLHNPLLFEAMETSADRLWQAFQAKDPDRLETSPSPLCTYCEFRSDCPAFFVQGREVVDLGPIRRDVDQYVDAKVMEKEGRELSAAAKIRIEQFFGPFRVGQVGEIFVELFFRQRDSIDTKRLKADHPDIYEKYKRTTDYTVLSIR